MTRKTASCILYIIVAATTVLTWVYCSQELAYAVAAIGIVALALNLVIITKEK